MVTCYTRLQLLNNALLLSEYFVTMDDLDDEWTNRPFVARDCQTDHRLCNVASTYLHVFEVWDEHAVYGCHANY